MLSPLDSPQNILTMPIRSVYVYGLWESAFCLDYTHRLNRIAQAKLMCRNWVKWHVERVYLDCYEILAFLHMEEFDIDDTASFVWEAQFNFNVKKQVLGIYFEFTVVMNIHLQVNFLY